MNIKKPYSKIIAGTMTWGSWGKQFSQREITDLIMYCAEIGITTFDHADIYGGYTTEGDFGPALRQSGIARDSVQLISKCGIQFDSEARANKIKHYNYSKAYVIWSVEQSLKHLQSDYLDVLLLHRPSPLMQPDEVGEAISRLVKDGKIKEFGVSNFTPSQIELLETAIPVSCNQFEFSLTEHKVMYDGTLDDSLSKERIAMSWSPLGDYFKEDNVQVKRIKKAIRPLQKKYDASADQLLLAWLLKHPVEVYPVVGTTSKNRLKDAMKAAEIELELEDWFILLKASQGHEVP